MAPHHIDHARPVAATCPSLSPPLLANPALFSLHYMLHKTHSLQTSLPLNRLFKTVFAFTVPMDSLRI